MRFIDLMADPGRWLQEQPFTSDFNEVPNLDVWNIMEVVVDGVLIYAENPCSVSHRNVRYV
jgi:hypothetical protein